MHPLAPYASSIYIIGLILILASVAHTDPMVDGGGLYGDNKHASDKRPFFVGSRYGRSQVYGAKDLRQVNVVPRNDRFFLGSRYGKRSDLTKEIESDSNNGVDLTYLACLHTGVSNLYRCYTRDSASLHGQQQQQQQPEHGDLQEPNQQQLFHQFTENSDLLGEN
ncbi:RYamide neuropeptides [Anopheles aquasalis]|uniref:RYamide neuropeptides n=1 Tax=Anopheles aquasalis TaxID=42839 RepID=UPI00215B11DC|nr:RYamide neuropeptides [Anopheles aquasalis]